MPSYSPDPGISKWADSRTIRWEALTEIDTFTKPHFSRSADFSFVSSSISRRAPYGNLLSSGSGFPCTFLGNAAQIIRVSANLKRKLVNTHATVRIVLTDILGLNLPDFSAFRNTAVCAEDRFERSIPIRDRLNHTGHVAAVIQGVDPTVQLSLIFLL